MGIARRLADLFISLQLNLFEIVTRIDQLARTHK